MEPRGRRDMRYRKGEGNGEPKRSKTVCQQALCANERVRIYLGATGRNRLLGKLLVDE